MEKEPIKEEQKEKKRLSLAFLLSAPTAAIGAALIVIATASVVHHSQERLLLCLLFFVIFALAYHGSSSVRSSRFRTVVHELKHAVLLLVTGSRVTDLQIAENSGHVRYRLKRRRTQFEPFVLLAPYFLPLFSFPLFFLLVVLEAASFPEWFVSLRVVLLAVTAAFDLQMGAQEIHPHQSDLQRIAGGTVLVPVFLFAVHLFWLALMNLFGIAGWSGLHRLVEVFFELANLR